MKKKDLKNCYDIGPKGQLISDKYARINDLNMKPREMEQEAWHRMLAKKEKMFSNDRASPTASEIFRK